MKLPVCTSLHHTHTHTHTERLHTNLWLLYTVLKRVYDFQEQHKLQDSEEKLQGNICACQTSVQFTVLQSDEIVNQ